MQLIFKYDLDRLTSYSINKNNRIKVLKESSYTLLSFPEVGYFNYAFNQDNQPFSKDQLKKIKEFYAAQNINKHQIIVAATCKESDRLLKASGYHCRSIISQTAISPNASYEHPSAKDLEFIKVNNNYLDTFTDLYLKGFGAINRDKKSVLVNFETLLDRPELELFLLQHNSNFVGINVLYHNNGESLLAGGAILPEFRNNGFHKYGLAYRIQQSLAINGPNKIVSWAYDNSISLQNMLKLKMKIQQKFNVYESCN